MATPIRPVPDPQKRAFDLALADRLGVDPEKVSDAGFEWRIDDGDDALVTWTGIAAMPADELLAIFNGAGAASAQRRGRTAWMAKGRESLPTAESTTRCPTCGSDGVTACVGLDGADHPDRPPYFDDRATAALDSMARRARMTAPTLVEFLLARYDETEVAAGEWRQRIVLRDPANPDAIATWLHNVADHVIAVCVAHRQIVERHDQSAAVGCGICSEYRREHVETCEEMRMLAAVYADHPDYREEWRP